jgi:hypothetical protein
MVGMGERASEARLADIQGVYEDCRANPVEAARLGGVEWIRSLLGMVERLGRA